MKTQKQWAKVFRKAANEAAKRIENRTFFLCCIRIDAAGGTLDERYFFEWLFKPKMKQWRIGWWDSGDNESRILALLLAAEICERGEF